MRADIFIWMIFFCLSSDIALAQDDYAYRKGYRLVFQDPFETFRDRTWTRKSHTFESNLAWFSPHNLDISNGELHLRVRKEEKESKIFSAAEIRSRKKFSHGLFEVRMKASDVPGFVTALFGYRSTAGTYAEIDIEITGNNTRRITLNHWINEHESHGVDLPLDFDAAQDFHIYAFEWTSSYIRWYADGKMIHETNTNIPAARQHIVLNAWISSGESWAGKVDAKQLPASAVVDWVRYYRK